MDQAILRPSLWTSARPEPREITAPERTARRGPVFIQDAVTPWGGETLLLSLLRAQALADLDDQP